MTSGRSTGKNKPAKPGEGADPAARAAPEETARLAAAVAAGDRRALARAITLVESTREDHRARAEALLERLMPAVGRSIRLGISGVPGVGKSTFIEAFGLYVIGEGHRLAVLAVDPSSKRGGGSILGDKTRMERLAVSPAAFIRPSPAGGTLGGVARRTREAMLVCEAAGFDIVLVETVGVGQSETAVADMVDMFVLLLLPASGDELQGIKRGIMELADLLVVNKSDGELAAAANRAAADYRRALQLIMPASPNWRTPVIQCSAVTGSGIAAVWQAVARYREALGASGEIAARRASQARAWLWSELSEGLLAALRRQPEIAAELDGIEAAVAAGRLSPAAAARRLLARFRGEG
ncbi:MAG TPA: methylmalonyl Co-A mutase-associated GTPase MeaB [Alphaproteobacteria bacterium]|nr:methylmalonyl Co-A mutase-associated GTPase MeaB [Alphaproteobacteria bacterium]